MSEQLMVIRCITCGNPTGGVVEQSQYQSLGQEQQTCRNCAAVSVAEPGVAQGEAACQNCGHTTFTVRIRSEDWYTGEVEMGTHGHPIVQVHDEPWDTNRIRTLMTCNNCDEAVDHISPDRVYINN